MVGDKTIFFRLVDKEIYSSMGIFDSNFIIDRGMALHKMIRLLTVSTAGDGYLTFMGNEFGHPEWIDFPREGNNWSYENARRMWSLVDDQKLRFRFLNEFDKAMIALMIDGTFFDFYPNPLVRDVEQQILVFRRWNYLFVFNFNSEHSYVDYLFDTEPGKYVLVLDSDNACFDGSNRIDSCQEYFTFQQGERSVLSLYIPTRVALVLKLQV